ncbi:hypothetical protein EV426DRAFT_624859 [Tirmania nivea]|nr:hypothetical protein EV426DRAFT_624859 [Tirmania nivea]
MNRTKAVAAVLPRLLQGTVLYSYIGYTYPAPGWGVPMATCHVMVLYLPLIKFFPLFGLWNQVQPG